MRRLLLPIQLLSVLPLAVKAQTPLAILSVGTGTANHALTYSGSSGTLVQDAGYILGSMAFQPSTSVAITGGTATLGLLAGPSSFTLMTSATNLINYSQAVLTSTSPFITSGEISPLSFVINDEASIQTTSTASSSVMYGLESRMNLSSSLATGNRAAGEFELFLTAPTGNGPAHHSGTYSAVSAGATISSNDGGIPEPGDQSRWAGSTENNLFSSIGTGTTDSALLELTALEVDTAIDYSTTPAMGAYRKLGMIIALGSGDTSRGVGEDAALVFGINATLSQGWKDVIEIGSFGGWPAATDSSLMTIGRDPLQGTSEVFPAAWGIDFRAATFTDGFLASNGFYVDPSGNVAVNQLVGGSINAASVVSGGTYFPGATAAGCTSPTASNTPTLTVAAGPGGATGSLSVSGWVPLGGSIAISSGGTNNASGDILTIPGTQTNIEVTGTTTGGAVSSTSILSLGFTPLFPSSGANPWPAASNNPSATPPSFCLLAFQIASVAVINPAFGYAVAPAVTVSASGVTTPGSISVSIGPNTVNVDTALNVATDIQIGGTQVVGPQAAGWGVVSGTTTRGVFNTGSASIGQIAETLGALIDDLQTHGLLSN